MPVAGGVDLPDVNVWLALTHAHHAHHARAQRYWSREAAPSLAFCRTTALALLRLTTNPSVMGGKPLSVAEAWTLYRSLRELDEVVLAAEPASCEEVLAAWADSGAFGPRLWTD